MFRAGGFGGQSFLLFVAVALWPWLAAQEALQRATVSLANYAGLIRKVAFPHELVVYASVAATLVLQFAGYLAVLVGARRVRRAGALRRPAASRCRCGSCSAIAVTGLALLLAALQVFIRDVEHVLMPVLMILMYLTPILYPLTLVPEIGAPVGRRQSVRLARRPAARRAARRPARAAVGRRRRGRRGAGAVRRRALGVPPAVAALRGFRVSAPARARIAAPGERAARVHACALLSLAGVGKDYAKIDARGGRVRLVWDLLRGRAAAHVFRALDDVSFDLRRAANRWA